MKLPILIAMLFALAGCRDSSDSAVFELRSPDETGITFANNLQEDDSVYNPLRFDYLYNGAGVAVGDLNNDGLQDLYFAGNMVSNRVYLNRGSLRFEDVTEAAGATTDAWSTGVTMVDINQDGLLDVYVCVAGLGPDEGRANLLFVNQGLDEDGTPRFVEKGREYGVADTGYSTHAVFFDYDRDDDLDLYVLTNALEEGNRNTIRPKYMKGEAPSTDRLYRNDGGTFTNVSEEAGITIEGYGLGVAVTDLDQDGWPDIYVANDFITNDLLWINNRDGTFSDRAGEYLKHQTYNGMGTDVADYNNDGRADIVVLDMLPEDNHRQKMMIQGGGYDKFQMTLYYGYQPQYVRNTLQLNNGPGPDGQLTFSEIGQLAGVHNTDWSWAPLFADFDNDGLKDLFISNGYRRDVTNLDYIVYGNQPAMARTDRSAELLGLLRELPEVKIPNYVFQNRGDLTFSDRSSEWGVDLPSYSTGAVYADLDNDGDLDLVVNNIDDPAFLFENRIDRRENGNGYLRVAFQGPARNVAGYGARAVLRSGGTVQMQEYFPVRGYKSTVEPLVHFGLGSAARVDSLEIFWPDGRYQILTDVPANQVLRVDYQDAGPPPPRPEPAKRQLFQLAALGEGLSYEHKERWLVDFKHTPLLPHKHSQGGPGVAIGDVDGNGLDDLYIGTDRGQPKELRLQTAPGRFVTRTIEEESSSEDMGALFLDVDGDGDQDLYVVSGGGFPAGEGTYQDRLYVNDGSGGLHQRPAALPRIDASGSCVVAADYDRDGDLDLFVCGRIVPERYPLPARSFLLRNDSEAGAPRFTDVTADVAPELAEVGLVTAALWSDFDQDGQPDLLVAGEWMPLKFFRNREGRFTDVTDGTGLPDTHGWWNSLVGGDFDNDGDTDFVGGNLGLNSVFRASPDEPIEVHAADFDQNGSMDPVISRYIQGESYAVAFRDVLIDQMIPMKARFPRYEDYANATLTGTLSEKERRSAYRKPAVHLASSYVENLGNGRFAIRDLPLQAQFAPVFGMLTGDYDSDGNLDLLVAGNSYATEPQAGWYDASIGSVLLGDGTGQFRHLNGSESGFFVDQDAKAIAELLIDEHRSAVLVTQNAGPLKIFSSVAEGDWRTVRLQPLDEFALLTFADGRSRRQELPYGSGYMAQSSRFLKVPAGVESVAVHDADGNTRIHRFPRPGSGLPAEGSLLAGPAEPRK